MLGGIRTNIVRFDVHFGEPEKGAGWEERVGKAAHINFLSDSTFIRLFSILYMRYFLSPDGR